MSNWTTRKRALFGAAIGMLVAVLAGLVVNAYINDVANEIHRPIVAQYGLYPTLQASQAAQVATQRAVMEGGLRGYVARIILDNNGIGYPEPTPTSGRVWAVLVLVGAIVGACASWRKHPALSFVAAIALLLGLNVIYDGPVALFAISVALVACAMITYVIFGASSTLKQLD